MTVETAVREMNWKAISVPAPEREITGGYAGDLLSWVMGRAQSGDCWFTIMSNINVAAVAQLTDVACVVFTEGVLPDESVIRAAKQHDINLLATDETTYAACAGLAERMR